MNKAYLLTGGNVGNRQEYLVESAVFIEADCGLFIKKSVLYETAPWGKTDQSPFLNQALELETELSAAILMTQLLAIEEKMGRKRREKYGPRIIDIDILLFNQDIIHSDLITIPHPEMANRRFALEPLSEIAPDYMHPMLHKSIRHLLELCPDKSPVKKYSYG